MAAGRILSAAALVGTAVGPRHIAIVLQARRGSAAAQPGGPAQPEADQIRQAQVLPAYRAAGLGDVAQGVGARIAVLIGIVGRPDTEGIDDQNEGAAHGAASAGIDRMTMGPASTAASEMVMARRSSSQARW